jgi:ribosomal protein L39E
MKSFFLFLIGVATIALLAWAVKSAGSKSKVKAQGETRAVNAPAADAKNNIADKGASHCEMPLKAGQTYHWDIEQINRGETTLQTSSETILARHRQLTLRLTTVRHENGGQEVMNNVHYGPLYLGDLEDFIDVNGVYNKQLLETEFPDISEIMAAIDSSIRTAGKAEMIKAFDRIWAGRTPDSEIAYDFVGYPETVRLRSEETVVESTNSNTPVPVWVLDRFRTYASGSTETRRFWLRKDDCTMVRYAVINDWKDRVDTTTDTLVRIDE